MHDAGARLSIPEELLLLALRDEAGTLAPGASFSIAVGGGLLAELSFREKIALDERKKRKLVDLVDGTSTGDDLLDECLAKLSSAKRRASVATWVSRFSGMRRLKHRLAEPLCGKRVLRATEKTVLAIFKKTIYPELDPRPEREIRERLRRAMSGSMHDVDPRTAVLLSLTHATGILRSNFDKREIKRCKERIEKIAAGEAMGRAASEVVQATQVAITAAIVASTTAATTAAIH